MISSPNNIGNVDHRKFTMNCLLNQAEYIVTDVQSKGDYVDLSNDKAVAAKNFKRQWMV